MYSLYERKAEDGKIRLSWEEDISLAGSKSGIIVRHLSDLLKPHHNPPTGWTIPISEKYHSRQSAVIIDIKPNSKEYFLCELDKVFGYSFEIWTPIMLRLKVLYNEAVDDSFDRYDFIYPDSPEIIYTMSYLSGSFHGGVIEGKWTFPGMSSTNSVLLWDEALSFFKTQVEVNDPAFLNTKFNLLSL